MKLVGWVVCALAVLALAACGNVGSSPSPGAHVETPSSTSTDIDALGSGAGQAERCNPLNAVLPHQAPALEAMLPKRVAGRDLATWSLAGRCWFEFLIDDDAVIEEILADVSDPDAVDLSRLAYAVAGRDNPAADPPYFVYAANRPQSEDEIGLTLLLLLGGAAYRDGEAGANLDDYEQVTIAGKRVYVGTSDMLDQTEHQRGKPYYYDTDDAMFIVITDDEGWATEAIGSLP
jgi:hypothetical protein